ncbi:MAG TPA: hypothetical protein VF895_03290 [Gaiellaceae bacterium]
MRRAAAWLPVLPIALLALSACGGSGKKAPVAGATPVETEIVSAGPSSERAKGTAADYWTTDRMQSAKPIELIAEPGKPDSSSTIPPPDGQKTLVPPTSPKGAVRSIRLRKSAFKVTEAMGYPFPYNRYRWSGPTTSLPARTWGKIFFSAPDGDYVCSGTAITSQNKSVVWTAGHCAANGGRRSFYNKRWIFVPGYDNGTAPYGRFVGKRFFTTQGWYRNEDSAVDLAAVVVSPVKQKTLVDTVGGQGIAFNQLRRQEYVSGGYPADDPFDGESLYVCDAPYGNSDLGAKPATIAIGCDMTGGSSGGGWLVNVQNGLGMLVSVNSYGYFDQPDAMYGPYQGSIAQKLYRQASTWR